MASNLKGRLARIRKLGSVKAAETPRPQPSFLTGWKRLGDFLWSRSLRYDFSLPASVDPGPFAPLVRKESRRSGTERKYEASRESEPFPPGRIALGRLRFFDLETTGLSGGTGTIAFLAAVGRSVGEGFELTQLFLEDFPGERAFVEALLELLGDGVVVSYNGKAFDMPLLRTRCVMNALAAPTPAQVDALFASRRLWKRVHGGASLGLLERGVLGMEREEDIPGSMIPELWLGFARTGEGPLMHLVLSHNAEDVLALARLVARAQAIFDEPRSRLAGAGVDRAGLGRTLLAVGRIGEGEEVLETAAGEGDENAALFLMRRYRLAARPKDCLRVEPLMSRDYRAAVERAKLYERLIRDLETAATWAGVALESAPGETEREAAMRRLRRIERKMV
jgi:uncharacterized protein